MPVESPYPAITVPEVDVWTYYLENNTREYPDDHVLFVEVATGRKLTFEQLYKQSQQFAGGLQQQFNWQKGDVLATMTPNDIDLIPTTFGTLLVGGVVCPLNFLYTVDELATQLTSSKAKALVTNVVCLDVARKAAAKVGLPANRILLVGDGNHSKEFQLVSSLRGPRPSTDKVVINPKEDLAYLVYSSGTTGLPKGVMLTHENIVANAVQIAVLDQGATHWKADRILGFLPLYHIYGVAVLMLAPVDRGTTTYIMQNFDLSKFCKTVQDDKITMAFIVPPVALALAKHPMIDQYNLKSLRYLHTSAAPTPNEVILALHDRLKIPIRQGYGLSEASPGAASQRVEQWNDPIGTSGRLYPSLSLKVEMNGKEVPTGEEGELCLRGPNIFKGYYNNPQATAEAFDADGWYHTGDIGKVDERGNIFITDRLKELIKYNGFQVAPAQLENLLLGHPAVADVAVTGVYNKDKTTELPRAYIVPAAGHKGDRKLEEELQKWLNERVSPHKKLRGGIRFVDAVPRSNAGKLLRRVLKEQAAAEGEKEGLKARL
ncbi:putative phenylacetyl-CoA ligase [Paraphoma chrysanthemicola]|uniref:Phenylacetyl-CoA ligase n=1 Tax=Paraphoma chrysanthemicola TaxID=798071 RepID=A0A8K0W063_9PLEO|nr:putative phenylacetyl-CoA ligase [Paraphoma chrysanthemicola]